jgi:hypothetical protein
MTTDDDRAAYLAGEDISVPDAQERRALDGIRGLLADPAVWQEPGAGLEAEIVAVISARPRVDATQARHERRAFDRRRLVAIAVAVVVLAAGTISFRSLRHRRTSSR